MIRLDFVLFQQVLIRCWSTKLLIGYWILQSFKVGLMIRQCRAEAATNRLDADLLRTEADMACLQVKILPILSSILAFTICVQSSIQNQTKIQPSTQSHNCTPYPNLKMYFPIPFPISNINPINLKLIFKQTQTNAGQSKLNPKLKPKPTQPRVNQTKPYPQT